MVIGFLQFFLAEFQIERGKKWLIEDLLNKFKNQWNQYSSKEWKMSM